MNQIIQTLVSENTENNSSNFQSFFFSGALILFNLLVMLGVAMYWMNPVMHEFISGRPLL